VPYLKYGCDDITCVIAYVTFKTEEEMEEEARQPQDQKNEKKGTDDKSNKNKKK